MKINININRIRRLYYAGTISVVIILVVLLSIIHLTTFKTESNKRIEQLGANTIDLKKEYMQEIIKSTIQGIDIEREIVTSDLESSLLSCQGQVEQVLLQDYSLEALIHELEVLLVTRQEFEVLIIDAETDNILAGINTGNKDLSDISVIDDYAIAQQFEMEHSNIIVGVANDYIESEVQKHTIIKIRDLKLQEDGYIWVNYILDYDGGDHYAIRLVHPNLAETEGMYLSTNTVDIQGNKPYLEELEGVIADGELYFEYYFEKKNSDAISHKMSYAKLYQPYDWVIATGVYLDDVDAFVEAEKEEFEDAYRTQVYRTILISAIFIVIAVGVLIFFELQINQLIEEYKRIFEDQNKQIESEKQKIEKLVYIDSLTQISNRRAITNYLQEFMSRSKRHKEEFSIGLGDIDWFKKVNDTYGHNAGDYVLEETAKIIKENIRMEDVVGRWGGEEFIILLTHSNRNAAYRTIEKIRQLIKSHEFVYDGEAIRCTMSFGIGTYSADMNSVDELVKIADDGMYKAKESGRNKTVLM